MLAIDQSWSNNVILYSANVILYSVLTATVTFAIFLPFEIEKAKNKCMIFRKLRAACKG